MVIPLFSPVLSQLEEYEELEEDGDGYVGWDGAEDAGGVETIDRVLWHQAVGSEERGRDPVVADYDPNSPLDWELQEFYIKWKGQSYRHCTWTPSADLSEVLRGGRAGGVLFKFRV